MERPVLIAEIRAWIVSCLRRAAIAGGLGVVALTLAVVRPDLMLVERVAFEGNTRASEVALRHLVDIRNGTSIWGVDLEAAARGAERHPWVRSASARRSFPATVVLEVEEYAPVALLQADGLHYVDRDGTVFLRARSDDLDYPVITGIEPSLERAHPDLRRRVVRDALWLLEVLDARGVVARFEISEVAFSRSRGFTVHVARGSRVVFGMEGLEKRLSRLTKLLDRGEIDIYERLLVDLAPATVAIVRPLPERGGEG